MARSFTLLSTSIAGSQKFRRLPDHKSKCLYVLTLASPLASWCGVFRYPTAVAASDAQLTVDETAAAFARMVEVGLIEHDPASEVVRIVNWYGPNAPQNSDHSLRLLRDYAGLSDGTEHMRLASFSECIVAILAKVPRWKPEKVEILMAEARPLIDRMAQVHGSHFLDAIDAELNRSQAFVRREIEFLIPAFAHHVDTLATPCPHPEKEPTTGGGTQYRDNYKNNYENKDGDVVPQIGENVQPFASPHGADVRLAEKAKAKGPRPETIASAKLMAAR